MSADTEFDKFMTDKVHKNWRAVWDFTKTDMRHVWNHQEEIIAARDAEIERLQREVVKRNKRSLRWRKFARSLYSKLAAMTKERDECNKFRQSQYDMFQSALVNERKALELACEDISRQAKRGMFPSSNSPDYFRKKAREHDSDRQRGEL